MFFFIFKIIYSFNYFQGWEKKDWKSTSFLEKYWLLTFKFIFWTNRGKSVRFVDPQMSWTATCTRQSVIRVWSSTPRLWACLCFDRGHRGKPCKMKKSTRSLQKTKSKIFSSFFLLSKFVYISHILYSKSINEVNYPNLG